MKNYISILFAGMVLLVTSCAQHRTCPTYTRHDVKVVKVAIEKI